MLGATPLKIVRPPSMWSYFLANEVIPKLFAKHRLDTALLLAKTCRIVSEAFRHNISAYVATAAEATYLGITVRHDLVSVAGDKAALSCALRERVFPWPEHLNLGEAVAWTVRVGIPLLSSHAEALRIMGVDVPAVPPTPPRPVQRIAYRTYSERMQWRCHINLKALDATRGTRHDVDRVHRNLSKPVYPESERRIAMWQVTANATSAQDPIQALRIASRRALPRLNGSYDELITWLALAFVAGPIFARSLTPWQTFVIHGPHLNSVEYDQRLMRRLHLSCFDIHTLPPTPPLSSHSRACARLVRIDALNNKTLHCVAPGVWSVPNTSITIRSQGTRFAIVRWYEDDPRSAQALHLVA